jgi:8-oxo-dGTP diphosphatase
MKYNARFAICDINDKTFTSQYTSDDINDYHVRKAARGILLKNGKLAWLSVSTKGYHKLPGGGIEKGETNESAFKREILEETGCECEIIDDGAVTIEYRDQFKLVQISYIFIAVAVGASGEQKLEQGEIDEGHAMEWYTLKETENLLQEDNPTEYEGRFIQLRDKSIFEFYKKKIRDMNSGK